MMGADAAGRPSAIALVVAVALVAVSPPTTGAESCALPTKHAGVTFPLDRLEAGWACRLRPIVEQFTTANKFGPLRAPLSESLYQYFLEHPVMAAALLNRLDLGLYKAEMRGGGTFWATDGEGTEGVVQPLYRDGVTRIYFAQGSHDGRFLPRVTGKAVVLLRFHPVQDHQGRESVDSTMVAYLRLDNRFLSGLMSLLRPLIGQVVNRQLLKGFEAVRRLGEMMHTQPKQVWFEATDPPALPDEEVAFLKQALQEIGMKGP
ncbi:hypothetical protein FBQ96_09465 [Nitrospirales bacterium NOB]|nr:MAG: hypothetical protein UZ03_NOB001001587 [Nitrospira sp. OLB3]MBV6469324.1 hypothetical protein [Nitrospirota bacterium]MCE7966489.1 hypothetical protein [Nitrospira sp. NTP2]MCK6494224.1 hypothetical protein [Nitrospira sp.]MDL1889793.1 hypothetical protein [Nitrospirales bacterium NOB]MEB2339915.1 hypothetical protein [Nitrospirales bacterium]